MDYSKGFHPHPRLRFSPPLGVGIESVAEYVDLDLVDSQLSVADIADALAAVLPEGIELLNLEETPLNEAPVSGRIRELSYEVTLKNSLSSVDLRECVQRFQAFPKLEISKVHKGKTKTRDLKVWVKELDLDGSTLRMTLLGGPAGSVHPLDAASAIIGLDREVAGPGMLVRKTSVRFEESEK